MAAAVQGAGGGFRAHRLERWDDAPGLGVGALRGADYAHVGHAHRLPLWSDRSMSSLSVVLCAHVVQPGRHAAVSPLLPRLHTVKIAREAPPIVLSMQRQWCGQKNG